jgi:hypothetical protein
MSSLTSWEKEYSTASALLNVNESSKGCLVWYASQTLHCKLYTVANSAQGQSCVGGSKTEGLWQKLLTVTEGTVGFEVDERPDVVVWVGATPYHLPAFEGRSSLAVAMVARQVVEHFINRILLVLIFGFAQRSAALCTRCCTSLVLLLRRSCHKISKLEDVVVLDSSLDSNVEEATEGCRQK